jgi:hypothetical protein
MQRRILMSKTVAEVGARYFEAWRRGDFDALRGILADDATFDGPMGRASNAEECIAGLQNLSKSVTEIVEHKTFVDGPDVLTWYELHTADAGPLPTVNWRHIEHGKITWIKVAFDPRPLVPPPQQRSTHAEGKGVS